MSVFSDNYIKYFHFYGGETHIGMFEHSIEFLFQNYRTNEPSDQCVVGILH